MMKLAALVFLGAVVVTRAAPPVRVAIFGPEAEDAAAFLAAEISQLDGIEVLERGQIELLLGEQSLGQGARERLALGRLLAADLLLLVGKGGDSFAYIDIRTGEELFRIRENSPGQLAASAAVLVKEARETEREERVTVAVLDEPESREVGGLVRDWLRSRNVRVLDRMVAREILEERTAVERGLRERAGPGSPFVGAKVILKLESGDGQFRLRVLGPDGSLLGISPFWTGLFLPDSVFRFLEPLLTSREEGAPPRFRQRVSVEALQSFYEGVALFESGKLLEATAEFQKAYETNNLFVPAYLWEARCYEAAGLPELGEAIQRWLETGLAGRGVAAGADATPRDGVTFLGVTDAEGQTSAAAIRVSMAAIDALSGPGLLLPESLGAIRDEYDLLAGATHTEGARWETSAGFVSRFTLRGVRHPKGCDWILAESLTGKTVATLKEQLGDDPGRWAVQLRERLPDFIATTAKEAAGSPHPPLILPDKKEVLAALKKTNRAAAGNVAILQLLLLDPAHPSAIGGRLRKGSDERDGLDNYLAHAKRDVLIRQLPASHPMRPWLELERIQSFTSGIANGSHLSGEVRDAQTDLKTFSEAHPRHPAGALARYLWIYDEQAKLPLAHLAEEADALYARLAAADGLPDHQIMARMAETLAWLARSASGASAPSLPARQTIPRKYRLEIRNDGSVGTFIPDGWQVNEYRLLSLNPEEMRVEAGAALAIQGRGDFQWGIDPEWMEKFPRSFSLASFIAHRGIHNVIYPFGWRRPLPKHFSGMRTHWRRLIDYTADTLLYRLEAVQTAEEFRVLDYPLQYFFHALHGAAFHFPEEEYDSLHQRFCIASAAAATRAGVPDQAPRAVEPDILDWRRLTRAEALRQSRAGVLSGPWFYRDVPAVIRRIEEAAGPAFDQDPPSYQAWWDLMHRGLDEFLSYREIAAWFVLPHLAKIHATYGTGTLSDDERAFLLDQGIVLMWAWHFSEAEKIFQIVVKAPPTGTSVERFRRGLQASALLHIGRLQAQAKNKPAAIETLRRCLEVSDGLDVRQCMRIAQNFRDWIVNPPGQRHNVASLALRLLDELRFDPAHAGFSPGAGAVQVETRQLDNASVTVFYRLPPPADGPPRVLVVLPNFNDGVAAFCADNHPLARWADANNLALVVPQFFHIHTYWRKDHPCAPFHFPNLWSGQALLDGLKQIGKIRPLDDSKLLFHGIGSGAHFASRFARWRPTRTGALSLHGGVGYSWADREEGGSLFPASCLKGLPVLLTCGHEDWGGDGWSERIGTEIYSHLLKESGAEGDFHVIDTTSHRSSPTRQILLETFLSAVLNPKSTHP